MKNRTKKLFKITGITLGALIVFLSAVIAFSINFIFTPEKLTPIVLNVANQNINAKLEPGKASTSSNLVRCTFPIVLNDSRCCSPTAVIIPI